MTGELIHTPGLWGLAINAGRIQIVVEDKKMPICNIKSLQPIQDAVLISAAPDMLNTFKQIANTGPVDYQSRDFQLWVQHVSRLMIRRATRL